MVTRKSCDFVEILSRHSFDVPPNCIGIELYAPKEGVVTLRYLIDIQGAEGEVEFEYVTGTQLKQFAESLIEFVDNH